MSKHNKIFFESQARKLFFVCVCLILFSVGAFAQNKPAVKPLTVPADFQSDGCSHFPDGDYVDCCVEHDKAYFVGGSWKMRWRADKKLYKCVAAKKGFDHKIIAPVMWAGVRVFGVSFLPTKFRWGFGQDDKKRKSESRK